uniref:Amino acid permease/ SLC12A domain-containing protein n=1 Tax=Tetranychus urticae TaxID=32264 RepID=T1K117_TETUR
MAFIIEWFLILESVIETPSAVRGYNGYVAALIDNKIAHFSMKLYHFQSLELLVILMALHPQSTGFTAIFPVVNLYAVFFGVVAGVFVLILIIVEISESQVPPNFGKGGFFPYGFLGVMKRAATCLQLKNK